MNDITFQLDINFGSLPRPGCGSRGARGRGRGRQMEETGPQPEAMVMFSVGFVCLATFFLVVVVLSLFPLYSGGISRVTDLFLLPIP